MARCTNHGCTRAAKGFKRCEPCRIAIRARQARIAADRKARGLCRCGGKRRGKHKLCADCRAYFSGRLAELQEQRRIDGLCPPCGRKPAPKRKLCRRCLAQHSVYGKRVYARWKLGGGVRPPGYWRRNQAGVAERIAAWKARQRAAGRCITCGRECDENPRTGKPFAMCEAHRDLAAEATRRRSSTVARRA